MCPCDTSVWCICLIDGHSIYGSEHCMEWMVNGQYGIVHQVMMGNASAQPHPECTRGLDGVTQESLDLREQHLRKYGHGWLMALTTLQCLLHWPFPGPLCRLLWQWHGPQWAWAHHGLADCWSMPQIRIRWTHQHCLLDCLRLHHSYQGTILNASKYCSEMVLMQNAVLGPSNLCSQQSVKWHCELAALVTLLVPLHYIKYLWLKKLWVKLYPLKTVFDSYELHHLLILKYVNILQNSQTHFHWHYGISILDITEHYGST